MFGRRYVLLWYVVCKIGLSLFVNVVCVLFELSFIVGLYWG